jgi:uncharacterized protein (TIGR00106 family)
MSVLLEFSMFPTDKGESVSKYVSRIIELFENMNITYKLTPMGTIVETETLEEALECVNRAYKTLESDCNRVYSSLKLDIRKNQSKRMVKKVESIEKIINKKIN